MVLLCQQGPGKKLIVKAIPKGQKEEIENAIIKKLQSLLWFLLRHFNSNAEA